MIFFERHFLINIPPTIFRVKAYTGVIFLRLCELKINKLKAIDKEHFFVLLF